MIDSDIQFSAWLEKYLIDNSPTGKSRLTLKDIAKIVAGGDRSQRPDERMVRYWLDGNYFPSRKYKIPVRDNLVRDHDLFDKMQQNFKQNDNRTYVVKSFNDLEHEYHILFGDILNQIENIYNHYPPPVGKGWENNSAEEYGDPEKWRSIYHSSKDTSYALRHKEQGIVGYWHFIPVESNYFERILTGENINSDITEDDVSQFNLAFGGCYDVYFIDFFIMPGHRIKGFPLLFDGLCTLLVDLAKYNNVYIQRIAANLSGKAIMTLCNDCGFTKGEKHQEHLMYINEIYLNNPGDENEIMEKTAGVKKTETEIWHVDFRSPEVYESKIFSKTTELAKEYRKYFLGKLP